MGHPLHKKTLMSDAEIVRKAESFIGIGQRRAIGRNGKRIEGTLDLFNAITLATIYGAQPYMGPAYWIPAFWLPALLVTHYITFVFLWKCWRERRN